MTKTIVAVAALALTVACGGQPSETVETTPEQAEDTSVTVVPEKQLPEGTLKDTLSADRLPENLFFNIAVAEHGTIKIRLHTQDAPQNVTNVANLAITGFYNGLTFHRIVPGFVVQGGDPRGDGTGGPGYTVEAEIKRKHARGSMAMARTGDQVNPERRSSGSQFYLCLEPLPQLDGA